MSSSAPNIVAFGPARSDRAYPLANPQAGDPVLIVDTGFLLWGVVEDVVRGWVRMVGTEHWFPPHQCYAPEDIGAVLDFVRDEISEGLLNGS
ncbi:MAG: hypothetical protein AMXMBFR84_26310 [Candidatus Hydrogenedentota bacterium]